MWKRERVTDKKRERETVKKIDQHRQRVTDRQRELIVCVKGIKQLIINYCTFTVMINKCNP